MTRSASVGLFLILFLFSMSGARAQARDYRLEKKLNSLIQGFHGEVGICVESLRSGKMACINADSLFPTASMIKIPIMIGIMSKIQQGALDYHELFIYSDSLLYPGVDILGSFKSGEKIELSKLLFLMLSTSDNTAALWLQSLAGGGQRINELLDSLGYKVTRVNSRTPGRDGAREKYGWGQTSPREMVKLMEDLYHGRILGPDASDRMIRMLGRNYWDEESLSAIPSGIFVASKNGAVDDSRSETLMVLAPHRPYIFSIITRNQADQRWETGNEGWVLARRLSALLWAYYEPHYRRK